MMWWHVYAGSIPGVGVVTAVNNSLTPPDEAEEYVTFQQSVRLDLVHSLDHKPSPEELVEIVDEMMEKAKNGSPENN